MRYLSILISNIFINVPTVLLVLMYAHFGTFSDSASIGIALAYAAPLYLLFSMQHGVAILGGNVKWTDAIALRTKLAPLYLASAVAIAFFYREWLILLVALYRFGDLLYEPVFCEKTRIGDARGMLLGSGMRLLIFLLGLMLGYAFRCGPVQTLTLLATLNLVMALISAGSVWHKNIREASLKWGDFLMGSAACLASLSVNIPRYFLEKTHDGELAAYSNILTVLMAGTLLFVSFNNLYFSRAARIGQDGVASFFLRSSLLGLFATSFAYLLCIGDYQIAKALIKLGLGANYLPYATLLPLFWIFYCALYMQNVANCVLIYFRGNRRIFASNFLLLVLLTAGFTAIPSEISAHRALIIVLMAMAVFLIIMASLVVSQFRNEGKFSRKSAA
ncbi:hypothetical protein [Cupriavidus metallidurans]|uniref:hypothetical protein n=1 Tax=Cupriavidus metallidurans TaxID=119219 RepID=UPI001CCF2F83|nr:hypothetical protein [Cupriavidus metallidurans]UBM11718.1 hypothetical protein LAI70_15375 [Cupriavidus metallidurans]